MAENYPRVKEYHNILCMTGQKNQFKYVSIFSVNRPKSSNTDPRYVSNRTLHKDLNIHASSTRYHYSNVHMQMYIPIP